MEKFKNFRPLKRASLILLLVQAIVTVITVLGYNYKISAYFYDVINLVYLAGVISICYGIWEEKRGFHIMYGYGMLAVASLFKFIYLLFVKGFCTYSWRGVYKFSFLTLLLGILSLAAYIAMFVMAHSNSEKKIPMIEKYVEKTVPILEKYWYIPFSAMGLIELIAIFWNFSYSFVGGPGWVGSSVYSSLQEELFIAIFVLMSLMWKYKDGVPKKERAQKTVITTGGKLSFRAYCGIVQYILLSVFTFGIWTMIWVYRMTDELNCVEGYEYRSPVKKLLLFIFIPFYFMYWFYQTALRTDKLAREEGLISDISMLSLTFSMFFPLGSMLLIQGKINEIVLKNNG